MKTILVDAWNTLVTSEGINKEMQAMLDIFSNPKIILTNANAEEKIKYGIIDMPYPVFSLEHTPNKTDPQYYEIMLKKLKLDKKEVIYFEHNEEAVKSAQSVEITAYHYDKDKKDLVALKKWIDINL